ncbi:low choriolytic enzyme [Drosophila guanche]|uniref:Metalloendopeptidase n=1 Tax=Drosophila guanche TaxID=7266 RepID=A0A3B0KCT2_DROGU|nr:low choriolytic enzyme [Drosophila guanche]SPP83526.1 blast:Zinc metalloproteinase nas-38 [Drosophila guanche]
MLFPLGCLFLVLAIAVPRPRLVASEGIDSYENYYNEIHVDDEQAEAKTRNALKSELQRWPGNRIYYRISGDYSDQEVANVRTAMTSFNEQTCVKFEEVNGSPRIGSRYVYFKKSPNMCGTRVGYNPISFGSHDVLLNEHCLSMPAVIQHETLHLLGLFHEQSRPDRHEYVQIEYDNIPRKYWSQFMAMNSTTTYDVPYDYDSVMHYAKNAFAKDPSKPTILALVDGKPVERDMGQVWGPSEGDWTKIRLMYKC